MLTVQGPGAKPERPVTATAEMISRHAQDYHAQIDAPIHAVSCAGQDVLNYIFGFQRKEEERRACHLPGATL